MRKAILFRTLLIALAALIVSAGVSAFILEEQYNTAKRREMLELAAYVSQLDTGASPIRDYEALAKRLSASADGTRVTFIAVNGKVLGDSDANPSAMENHLTRPEVQQALHTGYGEDIRSSHTLGRKLMYIAKKLPDGKIIRLSVSLAALYDHFWSLLPALLIGIFAAFLITPLLSLRLTKGILRPFRALAGSLRAVNSGTYVADREVAVYDEMVPIVKEIDLLSLRISDTLRQLTNERRRVDDLLNNMNEGLVVLDADNRILTINRSALAFFGLSDSEAALKGKNLLQLTHFPQVIEAANRACGSGEHAAFDMAVSTDGRILQIFLNPVTGEIIDPNAPEGGHTAGDRARGAIMLITDVTAARKAEQIRSEFVANASHELKTPLTSIKGFSELMETGMVQDPEIMRKYLGHIRSETERMIVLINDILRLSELESITSDTGMRDLNLKLVAQKVADSLLLQAEEKRVTVRVYGDPVIYHANADRMTQLFLNLIDNAIKYNREGGAVNVHVTETPFDAVLSVQDTGIGIPKEAQDRIFERFYRVDRSRSRKMGGTGLGLSIVKHIVGLYKGKVALKSVVDQGTTVEITLPKREETGGAAK